ncbi:MAG: amidohydrolase [Acholeplasmataceae bacterium]|nr:MAG: amidohydrolase [Acholeplasmataceae bacterium]
MKLWKNGTFHTMTHPGKTVTQIMTDQGRIIAIGEDASRHQPEQVVDLQGLHVYPGFVDAHMHLLGYGQKLSRLNLENHKDRAVVLDQLTHAFAGEPLFAEGYFDVGLTKHDLDRISPEVPIMLRHNDYHSLTVNTDVLARIGLTSSSGVLTEDDAQRAMDAFPKHTREQLGKLLEKAISSLYTYGITGAHSDDLYYFNGFHETVAVFEHVLENMPFRAHLLMHHLVLDDYLKSGRAFLDQHDFLQLGAIKLFYDGTISSRTALMHHPYKSVKTQGIRMFNDDDLEALLIKIRDHGLTAAVHVIGDLGLRELTGWLAKHPPRQGLHDRIIHASFADVETVKQLAGCPVVLDIQPQFMSSDLPWAFDYLGEPPALIYPWRTYLDAGLILAGSSDAPVEIPNPLLGIHAATERLSSHDGQCYGEHEKMTRFEAIRAYTTHANIPTYKSDRGLIDVGHIADFTLFDFDLETALPERLLHAKCMMTIVDETVVHQR